MANGMHKSCAFQCVFLLCVDIKKSDELVQQNFFQIRSHLDVEGNCTAVGVHILCTAYSLFDKAWVLVKEISLCEHSSCIKPEV